jgi:glyoxylase-like metal-dependent hydrolase (beta-lactamase superfamily II)
VPGKLAIGPSEELELHPTEGHVPDGMAIWAPWARVLIAGDFLSPVEIPMLSEGGSRDAYLATLRRLEPLVDQAAVVIPGHGEPLDAVRAAAILREDVAYLEQLPGDALPLARRDEAQRRIHAANRERMAP